MKRSMKQWVYHAASFCVMFIAVFGIAVTGVSAAGADANSATAVTLGTKMSGYAQASGQTAQWYKVTLPESGELKLNMQTYMKYSDIEFFNQAKEQMWYKTIGWDSTSKVGNYNTTQYLLAGTYYFCVKTHDRWGTTYYDGNYEFTFNYTSAGETFPESQDKKNNELSTANPIAVNGTKYTGMLADYDGADYYQFTLPASGSLNITQTIYMETCLLQVYDAKGVQVWYSQPRWTSATGQGLGQYTLELAAGTYYYVVQYATYENCNGKYEFTPVFTPATETFPETQGGINNTLASASQISFNQEISGHLGINDDCDYYRLAVDSPRNLNIILKSSNLDNVRVSVFDANGQKVNSDTPYKSSTTGMILYNNNNIAVNAGVYYIYVGSYEWKYGSYTLNVGTYVPVSGLNISKKKLTMNRGAKAVLTAGVAPADATNQGIVWSSTNSNVVSVNNGSIKAVSAGTATIYATSSDNDEIMASCVVTVKPSKVKLKRAKYYKYRYSGTKAVHAKWTKSKGATGYQLQLCKSKKFKKGVKKYKTTGNSVYYTVKKGTYYVRVRPYVYANGKYTYGSFSNVKKVRIK